MVKLRTATRSDLEFCYELRIFPEVMKNSFKKNTITLNSHRRWFLRKLGDPNCYFFIIMLKKIKIGQIRVELKGNKGEISISILPEYSNKGYGSASIQQACKEAFLKKESLASIMAHIIISNLASKKAFEKSGFVSSNIVNYQAIKCFEMTLYRDKA